MSAVSPLERMRDIAARALAGFPELELHEVDVSGQGRARVVSVTIDKPGGVSAEDCAIAAEAVSALLDVEDPIEGAYRLEVASPGLERPLGRPEQYARAVGHDVKVKVSGSEPLIGRLLAASETGITVEPTGSEPVDVSYSEIVRARTILLGWDAQTRPPKPGRKRPQSVGAVPDRAHGTRSKRGNT